MLHRKPFMANLDEVIISRQEKHVSVTYKGEKSGGMSIEVGDKASRMTDQEILDLHNDLVARMEQMKENYEFVATEIAAGKPQIEYSRQCNQWTLRGDVLKFIIHDQAGNTREPVIEIDDKEMSWEDFGAMLCTYAGWGARLVVVPDDEIHVKPRIKVRKGKPQKRFRTRKEPSQAPAFVLFDGSKEIH